MTAYYYMVQKHRAYNHYNFFKVNKNNRFERLFGSCDYDKHSPLDAFVAAIAFYKPEDGITKENFCKEYILTEIKFKK